MMESSVNGMNIPSDSSTENLGQQDFLRLMVAQIQSQDPEILSPMTQFTGVNKVQESMQQMANSLQSNQALQASALVGRKVMIPHNTLTLDNESELPISVEIPLKATQLMATIYDELGVLIKRMALDNTKPGLFQFFWDGMDENHQRLSAGNYIVSVQGLCDDEEITLPTMTYANVDSVSLRPHDEGLKLNIAGIGPVSLDQVKQIAV